MNDRLNIGLLGYGQMGKEVERLASTKEVDVVFRSDETIPSSIDIEKTDVIIEFTVPKAVLQNVQHAAQWKKNIVIGTTGWYHHIDEVRKIVEETGIGLLYAQNFSVGVHLFLRMVNNAAKLMNNYNEYDIALHERHHRRKADAPSGTALKIADVLLENIDRKKKSFIENPNKLLNENELYISSARIGNVPGTHSVLFDSSVDSIELTHTARSREGFALGALKAAQWLKGKSGFYSIEDMIDEISEH